MNKFEAIVVGASAGGLQALTTLFKNLPADFQIPIIVVQHRAKDEKTLLEEVLSHKCKIVVTQADEKEAITAGKIYFAPPDYHLLIEKNRTFSLSADDPVNFSRPSIDVLFEIAAEVYCDRLMAIILTGANHDGSAGIRFVRKRGGTTVAQDPGTSLFTMMPQSAINTGCVQHILTLPEIAALLINTGKNNK